MMWRDVYLGCDPPPAALRERLASAFGVATGRVAVVADVADVPPGGAHEVVAVSYPFPGEHPRMLSLYVVLPPRAVEALDQASVLQALCDGLGAPVLVPVSDDPNPFLFRRFRPSLALDNVAVDPTALDERGELRIIRLGLC